MGKGPRYLEALREALATGYRVDVTTGVIYGRSGRPLKPKPQKGRVYPVVTLGVKAYHRPRFTVAAHKVVAYAKFGDRAFRPGIQVRHKDGNPLNMRGANLLLGTASQNAMDKPPEVRRRMAQIARAAQGPEAWNRKFSAKQVTEIRRLVREGGPGTQAALSRKLGISASTISRIVSGTYYSKRKRA